MRGLVIVGDYFEDTELIATIDVLKRHKDKIDIASVMGRIEVESKLNIKMKVDLILEDAKLDGYDFLLIPGGPGAFNILKYSKLVEAVITYFVEHNKVVCAICAAPMLIGRLGYLNGKHFTVHPGFEDEVIGGIYHRDLGVVEDGNFITSKSMYYSIPFGLKIIEHFFGKSEADILEKSLKGE